MDDDKCTRERGAQYADERPKTSGRPPRRKRENANVLAEPHNQPITAYLGKWRPFAPDAEIDNQYACDLDLTSNGQLRRQSATHRTDVGRNRTVPLLQTQHSVEISFGRQRHDLPAKTKQLTMITGWQRRVFRITHMGQIADFNRAWLRRRKLRSRGAPPNRPTEPKMIKIVFDPAHDIDARPDFRYGFEYAVNHDDLTILRSD